MSDLDVKLAFASGSCLLTPARPLPVWHWRLLLTSLGVCESSGRSGALCRESVMGRPWAGQNLPCPSRSVLGGRLVCLRPAHSLCSSSSVSFYGPLVALALKWTGLLLAGFRISDFYPRRDLAVKHTVACWVSAKPAGSQWSIDPRGWVAPGLVQLSGSSGQKALSVGVWIGHVGFSL